MNCFEARREFGAFWRKELANERREAFLAHLAGCSGCDSAFRNFALSAPVLHSAMAPERPLGEVAARVRNAVSARRPAAAYRGRQRPRQWASMAAAVVVLMAGVFAAYMSVKAPVGNLADALSQSDSVTPVPVAELFATQTETHSQGNDLAG